MRESISNRASALFKQARADTASGIQRVAAEHSHAGRLYSGATIKRFIEVHGTTSRQALAEAIAGIGRRAESRGLRWRRMIDDVRRELDKHLAASEQSLNEELLKVLAEAPKLSEPLFASVREQLFRDLNDYREGWTGTPGRPWSERHKVLYTTLVALGGAALTVITGVASKLVQMSLNLGN